MLSIIGQFFIFLPKNKGGGFRKKHIYEAYQSNLRTSTYVSLKSRYLSFVNIDFVFLVIEKANRDPYRGLLFKYPKMKIYN